MQELLEAPPSTRNHLAQSTKPSHTLQPTQLAQVKVTSFCVVIQQAVWKSFLKQGFCVGEGQKGSVGMGQVD